jgi:hypothetical protein
MASRYAESTGEALTADDTEGVCALHPPDPDAENDDCTPRHGFSGRCGGRLPEASGGCAVTPQSRRSGSLSWLLAAAFAMAWWRRSARR